MDVQIHSPIYRFTAELFAQQVSEAIKAKDKVLNIDVNSPGGSVDAGNSIVTAMERFKDSGGRVNLIYSGLSASYVVFLAPFVNGLVEGSPLSRYMAHAARFRDDDTVSDDEKKTAQDFNNKMRAALKSRDVPEELLSKIFDQRLNVWLTASEAEQMNLIDEVKNFDISLDNVETINQLAANGSVNELFDYYQTHQNELKMAEEKKAPETKEEPKATPTTEVKTELKHSPEYQALLAQNKAQSEQLAALEAREKKALLGRRVVDADLLAKMSIEDVEKYCASVPEPEEKKEEPKAEPTNNAIETLNKLLAGEKIDGAPESKPEEKAIEIGSPEFLALDDEKQDEILKAHNDKLEAELKITQTELKK